MTDFLITVGAAFPVIIAAAFLAGLAYLAVTAWDAYQHRKPNPLLRAWHEANREPGQLPDVDDAGRWRA